MHPTVDAFLTRERACALATLLADGSPHAAAVHFSHRADPLTLFVQTERSSRKCEALRDGQTGRASVVVGFSETEWLTVQLNGAIRMITDAEELRAVHTLHYAKHPEAEQYRDDPDTAFLAFTPDWWRYTDFKTSPPQYIASDGGTPSTSDE